MLRKSTISDCQRLLSRPTAAAISASVASRLSVSASSLRLASTCSVALAEIAGSPIQLAETVENGAANPMLGIRAEGDFLVGGVLGGRIEQAHHAGVNQVIEFYVYCQGLLHMRRDGVHEVEMLGDEFITSRKSLREDLGAGGLDGGVHALKEKARALPPDPGRV